MAELAGTRAVRLGADCDLRYYRLANCVLAVAVRDELPHKRASSFAVVLLALLGVALMLAAFRVDCRC